MYRYQQEPIGTSDPDPEPRMTIPPRLCPFSVYDYPCGKNDCAGCDIKREARAKANENEDDWPPARHHLNNMLGVKER